MTIRGSGKVIVASFQRYSSSWRKRWARLCNQIRSSAPLGASKNDAQDNAEGLRRGGGLLAGVLVGLKNAGWTDTLAVGVETFGADCLHQTIRKSSQNATGDLEIVTLPAITSRASSLGARAPSAAVAQMVLESKFLPITIADEVAMAASILAAGE